MCIRNFIRINWMILIYCLSINCMSANRIDIGESGSVRPVSFVSLIVAPDEFIGDSIGLYGILAQHGLEVYVYKDELALKCANIAESFQVEFHINSSELQPSFIESVNKKPVFIEAIVRKSERDNTGIILHVSRIKKVE